MGFMDWVHTGLDVAGMIPAVGNVADLANAGIYAVEGDAVNAAISLAGCVEGVGQAATGARVAGKLGKEAAEQVLKRTEREVAEKLEREAAEKLGKATKEAEQQAAKKAEKEVIEKNVGTKVSKRKSRRLKCMGKTPSKNSGVGKKVQDRMRKEGKLKEDEFGNTIFQAKDGKWYPLKEADMAHYPKNAVDYWNETGYKYGEKSREVRDWMKNPDNYILDHFSANRSEGARLRARYR